MFSQGLNLAHVQNGRLDPEDTTGQNLYVAEL